VKEVVVVCDPSYKNVFEGSYVFWTHPHPAFIVFAMLLSTISIHNLLKLSYVIKFKDWYIIASEKDY
jgi:hypothetical protein